MTHRNFLALFLLGFFLLASLVFAASTSAKAEAKENPQHALSLFGAPKYASGFSHFDYVNPHAPKGGRARLTTFGSFDSFNPYIIKGGVATGIGLIYDTLTTPSLDEPGTQYGLVAQAIAHPQDFSSVTFTLHPQARFHDGTKMSGDDVIWTFNALTKNHPFYKAYYKDVAKVTQRITRRGLTAVTFHFSIAGNRELPQIIGALPVLPKHYWTKEAHNIAKTTLTPPLGSGPYRIGSFETGRYVNFERVENYWARDLNVNRGAHNFKTIRYDYFGDLTIAFEAFKAGEIDFQEENNSKRWATAYTMPAIAAGDVVLETSQNGNTQGMQGFILNTRRALFQDPLVREALVYAYNFEWANQALFYGQYTRTDSYFDNSELASTASTASTAEEAAAENILPSPAELALLEPLKDDIPPRVFTTPYTNPTNRTPSDSRKNLRHAKKLLTKAGWEIVAGKLQKDGQPFEIEFLLVQSAFERVVAPYIQNLKKLGITARIRTVDATQYQNRMIDYDFDVSVGSFGQSLSPGNEQRSYWGSRAGKQAGGRNLIGIQSAAVDRLVEHIIFAQDRPAQIAATRALDRVLLWNFYVVPHWHLTYHRLAYWKNLAHPAPLPAFNHGFPTIWWHKSGAGAPSEASGASGTARKVPKTN